MTVLEWLESVTAIAKKVESVIPWLGYLVVSTLGGVAAYIKEWEDKYPDRPFRAHVFALVRRLVFALIAGLVWYYICAWQGMLGSPLSYLGATLVGLYSAEFLDFLWAQMKARLAAKAEDPKR